MVRLGDFVYTFTNIYTSGPASNPHFVYARLTKFTPEGSIAVVETKQHIATVADVANLIVASSPFIYVPAYSGIAYQHVWNKLQREQFERAFKLLIEEKHQRFFAESFIEPISNLRTFVQQLAAMSAITKLEATVHPPNPLFGILWGSLRRYMQERHTAELNIREEAGPSQALISNVPKLAGALLDTSDDEAAVLSDVIGPYESAFGDAAVLMAADGYGKARIEGIRNERRVVIRTQDSQLSIKFDRDPAPEHLDAEVRPVFARITEERYMEHGDEAPR